MEWVDFHRHDLRKDEGVVRVYLADHDVVRHPGWNYKTLDNDLALIFLSSEESDRIGLDRVKPIALHDDDEDLESNENLKAIGWGLKDPYAHADVPRSATMEYVTNDDCAGGRPFLWPRGRIAGSMLCAMAKDHVAGCNIDSGGPIIRDAHSGPVLVGLSSFVSKISAHRK